jgi:ferredoxin
MNLGLRRGGTGRRVVVDNDRCELYGICEAEAPTLFALGPDGRLTYRRSLGDEDVAQAASAARCCPMQAIALEGGRK